MIRPLTIYAASKNGFEVCADEGETATDVLDDLWKLAKDDLYEWGWKRNRIEMRVITAKKCPRHPYCKHYDIQKEAGN